jgi:hypothetical protein
MHAAHTSAAHERLWRCTTCCGRDGAVITTSTGYHLCSPVRQSQLCVAYTDLGLMLDAEQRTDAGPVKAKQHGVKTSKGCKESSIRTRGQQHESTYNMQLSYSTYAEFYWSPQRSVQLCDLYDSSSMPIRASINCLPLVGTVVSMRRMRFICTKSAPHCA